MTISLSVLRGINPIVRASRSSNSRVCAKRNEILIYNERRKNMKISKKHLLVAAVATVLGGTDAFAKAMLSESSTTLTFDPEVAATEQRIPAPESVPGIERVEISRRFAVIDLRGRAEGERVREGIRNIERILANPGVFGITLISQDLNDDEVRELVDIVNEHENIGFLSLAKNSIGSDGARALAELKHPVAMILNNNHMGDEGAQVLIEYLQRNYSDRVPIMLALTDNGLTPKYKQKLKKQRIPGLIVVKPQ